MGKNYLLLVFVMMFFVACKQEHAPNPANCMAFDDVEFISEFSKKVSLAGSTVDMDVIGILDIAIYDTILAVSSSDKNGYLDFLSLSDMNHLGKYLKGGRGPNEMLSIPSIGSAVPFYDGDDLKIAVFDGSKSSYYMIDIGETIRNSELDMVLIADSLPSILSSCIYVEDSIFICDESEKPGMQRQIRYLLRSGKKYTPANFEKLNSAYLPVSWGFTVLSSDLKYNKQNGMIVERPIFLNNINLYSVDGEFSKSICLDQQVDDIDEFATISLNDMRQVFADTRIYSDYFGVLYLNETVKSMQLGKENKPSVLFFNWKGKPLMELELDHFATSFDIDFVNNVLYTLDRETEEIYVYDIKDVLEKL